MADEAGSAEQSEIHLVAGLSSAQQAEARRIFAALNETRGARWEHPTAEGDAGTPLPLCGSLLTDGGLCLLPTPHGPRHRMEEAPAAVQELVADLRSEVADARRVALGVYR